MFDKYMVHYKYSRFPEQFWKRLIMIKRYLWQRLIQITILKLQCHHFVQSYIIVLN
jgi:hypothetical protein